MPPVAIEADAGPWLRGLVGIKGQAELRNEVDYAPQFNSYYEDNALRPTTALTLADGYKLKVDYLLKKAHFFVADIDDWTTAVLPIRFSESMVTKWEEEITRFTLFQITSEGISPQLIEFQSVSHAVKKDRWQQGFEMKEEWFATKEGLAEFDKKLMILANNALGSMQYAIKIAIASAPDHWQAFQRQFGREMGDYYGSFQADTVEPAGALSINDKGIHRLRVLGEQYTEGSDIQVPVYDTLIIPAGRLANIALNAAADYELNASEVGVAAQSQMLKNPKAAMARRLPDGMVVYEDRVTTATNKKADEMYPFRVDLTSSSMSILENTKLGEVDPRGIREPTIELLTIPGNDWTKFSIKEAINNDVRFDHVTGQLHEGYHRRFKGNMQKLIDNNGYDFSDGTPPDFFMWRVGADMVNGVNRNNHYEMVRYYGDFEDHKNVVTLDHDLAVAHKMMKYALEKGLVTQEDIDTIDHVVQASMNLTNLNEEMGLTNDDLRAYVRSFANRVGVDTEWGGNLRTDDFNPTPDSPYGFSLPLLLSYLKTSTGNQRRIDFPEWGEGQTLDYPKIRAAIYRVWNFFKQACPDNSLMTPRFCPPEIASRLGTSAAAEETKAKIAFLSHFITGMQYPTFVLGNAAAGGGGQRAASLSIFTRGTGIMRAENALPLTDDVALASQNVALFRKVFDEWVASSKAKEIDMTWTGIVEEITWQNFVTTVVGGTDYANTEEKKRNILAQVVSYLLPLLDGLEGKEGAVDFRLFDRIQPFDANLINAFASTDVDSRVGEQNVANNAQVPSLISFTGDTWRSGLISRGANLSPADPKNPSKPLIQVRANPGAAVDVADERRRSLFARARMDTPAGYGTGEGPRTLSVNQLAEAEAGGSATTREALGYDNPTVATEPSPQFIGSAGYALNGPFTIVTQSDDNASTPIIAERRNMLKRFTNVKHAFSNNWFARACGFGYLASTISKDSLFALIDNNIPIPMNYILANPFINIRTDNVIMAKRGEELGFTATNYNQSRFARDALHLEATFNMVGWFVAVVTNPLAMMMFYTAAFSGYNYGLNAEFFNTPEKFRECIQDRRRLFNAPSMFAFSVPPTFTRDHVKRYANPCNLFGKPNFDVLRFKVAEPWKQQALLKPSFPSQLFYETVFGLSDFNKSRPFLYRTALDRKRNTHVPGDMALRKTRIYNATTGQWEETSDRGTGVIDKAGAHKLQQVLSGHMMFPNTFSETLANQ